jgi:hypothetical protein
MKKYPFKLTEYGKLVWGRERHKGKSVKFAAKCNHQDLEFERKRSDKSKVYRQWVQLENGHWRCSSYKQDEGSYTYERTHEYDLKTGRVTKEWDTSRRKNLADIRVKDILSINELTITDLDYLPSLEIENETKPKTPPSKPPQSLF